MMKTPSKIVTSQIAAAVLLSAASFAQTSAVPAAGALPEALSGLKYDHVSLSVQDIDREVEWYTRVLGFKELKRLERPNMVNVNMRNANMRIDLIKYTGSIRTPADPVYMQQGWAHLALTVPDVKAAVAALKALGADVKGNALRDPEGNEMEIFPETMATPATPPAPQAPQG
jgi:lactoylglutathione lyase